MKAWTSLQAESGLFTVAGVDGWGLNGYAPSAIVSGHRREGALAKLEAQLLEALTAVRDERQALIDVDEEE